MHPTHRLTVTVDLQEIYHPRALLLAARRLAIVAAGLENAALQLVDNPEDAEPAEWPIIGTMINAVTRADWTFAYLQQPETATPIASTGGMQQCSRTV